MIHGHTNIKVMELFEFMRSPPLCETFKRSKLYSPVSITSINSTLCHTVYLYVLYELIFFSLVAV